MRLRILALLLAIPIVLSGCGLAKNLGAVFIDNRQLAPESPFEDGSIENYYKSRFLNQGALNNWLDKYFKHVESGDSAALDRARGIRNELIMALVYTVDIEYERYTDLLITNKGVMDFSLTVAELGVGVAGAVTGHEATGQLMSALGAALTGTRSSYDSTFFQEKTVPVIVAQMNASRRLQREFLLKQLPKTVTKYPLGAALSDVVDYYLDGTMVSALGKLGESTAAESNTAERAKQKARGGKSGGAGKSNTTSGKNLRVLSPTPLEFLR